jgi:VanZ family protein
MPWWKKNRFLLLALACGFPFFFLAGPGYYASRSFKAAWDLGHVLFFTLATLVLFSVFQTAGRQGKVWAMFLRVFFLVLAAGIAIELLQGLIETRFPGTGDVLRNQLGVLVGTAIYFSLHKQLPMWSLRALQVAAVVLLLVAVRPFLDAVVDEHRAAAEFPVLSDFTSPLEISRWQDVKRLQWVGRPVRHGTGAMRVQLTTGKYSGVSLFYFPHDWSGYRWLHFSVYNPQQEPLKIHARIHDTAHGSHGRVFADRFNRGFLLEPGWNDLRISLDRVRAAPAGREMDMRNIEGFGIFVVRQPRPLVIYLDNVYLGN